MKLWTLTFIAPTVVSISLLKRASDLELVLKSGVFGGTILRKTLLLAGSSQCICCFTAAELPNLSNLGIDHTNVVIRR